MQTEGVEAIRGFEISGFSVEGGEHLQRSAEHTGPVVPAVLDALYDHLLSLPETRGFLQSPDTKHRKQSLVSWITRTIEGPHNALLGLSSAGGKGSYRSRDPFLPDRASHGLDLRNHYSGASGNQSAREGGGSRRLDKVAHDPAGSHAPHLQRARETRGLYL